MCSARNIAVIAVKFFLALYHDRCQCNGAIIIESGNSDFLVVVEQRSFPSGTFEQYKLFIFYKLYKIEDV